MTKKKKQKPGIHDQKIIAARHKNEFMARIKYYTDLWLGQGSFDLIPSKYHPVIYAGRFSPFRLVPQPGVKMKPGLLDEMKGLMMNWMKIMKFMEGPGSPVSFLEFNTHYMNVHHAIGALLETAHFEKKELQERFNRFLSWDKEIFKWGNHTLDLLAFMLGIMYSSPDTGYYWFDTTDHDGINEQSGNYKIFHIYSQLPVTAHFNVNKDNRPAFKLGYSLLHVGIQWFLIRPPDAGVMKWREKYEVYIQAHALQRLYERIDCVNLNHIMMMAIYSMFNPEIIYENGKMLLALNFSLVNKLGYFLADVVDGKLLLRTFLFITNEGTPEARKLKEISGLGKLDIKYWNIDKLSTFLNSDIILKPDIKKIFMDAGCGGLFNLGSLDGPDLYKGKLLIADEMFKYLQREEEEIVDLMHPATVPQDHLQE